MARSTHPQRSGKAAQSDQWAHMYPESGPAQECGSDAERTLYYRFREKLGPEFHVVHSVKWNTIADNGKMQPGEADFIVIHPTLGIAILEVKGGGISYHQKSDRWFTVDRRGRKWRIKDPFHQAMKSAKVLERKVRAAPATRPYAADYAICYGVWFPDITWPRDGSGTMREMDELVLDRADVKHPRESLTRLMAFAHGANPVTPLSDDAIAALIGLMAPDFTLVESPLSEIISADATIIRHMTSEQSDRLMAMWQSERQLAVPGHAGTGKTAIALEMAWRLAEANNKVLLLCTNRTLAEHLRWRLGASQRMSQQPFAPDLLQILSLHELVIQLASAGKVRGSDVGKLTVTYAKEQDALAEISAANLDVLARRDALPVYDAVLVDEAQDIDKKFWPSLRRLLRESDDPEEPDASYFYAFYDPAQRDLPGEWDPAWTGIAGTAAPLSLNCRNTEAIYALMATLNPRLLEAPFRGPSGRPVIYRDPAAESTGTSAAKSKGAKSMRKNGKTTNGEVTVRVLDAETMTLEHVLNELIEGDGVRPDQVLVVTCRSGDGRSKNPTRWRLREQQELGRRSLEWIKPTRSDSRIALSTIRASKGLESPVVILAELDGVLDHGRHDQLLYTAISRAMNELIILAPPDAVAPRQPGWWERFFKRTPVSTTPAEHPGRVNANASAKDDEEAFIAPEDPDAPPALRERVEQTERDGERSSYRDPSEGDKDRKTDRDKPSPDSATPAFVPSHYQQDIFDFVRKGVGNGIVSAVAGSGKTTTLVEAAKRLTTRNAIFLAFNNHIARHLGQRLHGSPMFARTIHSVGLQAVKRYLSANDVTLDDEKYTKLARAWVHGNLAQLDAPSRRQATDALRKLVDLARKTLTPPADVAAMREMAAHFSVECDAVPLDMLIQAVPPLIAEGDRIARGREDDDGAGESASIGAGSRAGIGAGSGHANDSGNKDPRYIIDFTDMVYLPYAWNLPSRWHMDWVFVDEAQDLNAAQLELALKCCGPNGRMLFVGDRHQAIYGFSGADSDAFDNIKRRTNATEFPLSVCYRCPTSHLALARELVSEIEPKENAPVGVLETITPGRLPKLVQKGDMILGRKTAPLVELCIKLIRDGKNAQVKGHDIGVSLTQVVQEVTRLTGYTWQRFGQFLGEYQRQQTEKIQQFDNPEAELERLDDRVAAVRVCYEMFAARDAAELCREIDKLFDGDDPDVLLSTIHRTKGLEAERVFLLEPDEMPLHWPNQQPWEAEQEHNIKYVGLTRAKDALYLVKMPVS